MSDLEQKMDISSKNHNYGTFFKKKGKDSCSSPLQKIMIPINGEQMKLQINSVKDILLSELNIKEIEFISTDSDILTKQIKPNFKTLGPKFGKDMKLVSISVVNKFTSEDIKQIEKGGNTRLTQI